MLFIQYTFEFRRFFEYKSILSEIFVLLAKRKKLNGSVSQKSKNFH